VKHFCFCVLLISLGAANHAAAQCSDAPSNYSTACTEMQGYMGTFATSTLSSGWHGTKSPAAFGTELLSANSNISLTGILSPNALSRVQLELDGMAKLGVQFVTIGASFPLLYQPFFTYNNDPQDYQSVLNFYLAVMAAVRQRGMKVLIETTVVFPNYATDLPLMAYYGSLSSSEITSGRAQVAQIVAQQLQPDWMNLGSEPDTISALIGLSAEYSPQDWATQVSTIVAQLRAAGIQGKPLIGAGCGAWQQNGSDYVQALMSTGIDYYDMHTFAVNMGYLNDAATYVDMATAAGKRSAISETWDHKLTDAQLQGQSEFGIIDLLATVEPYNAYSFWATEDAEYLGEIIDFAYWKQLYFVSPFESELFFANVDYNETASLSGSELTATETMAEAAALNAGTLSPLGQWYAAAIKAVNAATVSSASGLALVAPVSMVSIYGVNLASTSASAPAGSLALPTDLAGTSATLTDANGVQTPLPLFFAGPSQVNAQIPAGAGAGPAVITINTPAGSISSPVDIAPVAPGLFSANESGTGVAAAQFVTNADGAQTTIDIFSSCAAGSCTAIPLNVGVGQSALVLYGTGIQNRASLSDVTVTIGTLTLPAAYAGPAPGFTGLDQVNVLLPQNLAGNGTVNITVSIAGTASNAVTATFYVEN
jgi:uncharacterized protein (TIGR03437 family)